MQKPTAEPPVVDNEGPELPPEPVIYTPQDGGVFIDDAMGESPEPSQKKGVSREARLERRVQELESALADLMNRLSGILDEHKDGG